jgi:hypothetical protein
MQNKWKFSAAAGIMMLALQGLNAQVLEQDSLALVAFYNSTGGPGWNNNNNWLTGPVSSWYGVTVEGNRVSKITIYNNNLNGFIPSDIGNLNNLTDLALGYEPMLYGVIPAEIGQLMELESLFIGNCINIRWLALFGNSLTDPIPPEIGNLDKLLTLDLHNNQLSGPIPPELGNCTSLLELRLNNNNLTGLLPVELAGLDNLNSFNVSNNALSGPVPDEFSMQISYWFFHIHNNQFDYLPPFNNWYLMSGLSVFGNKLRFEHLESHALAGYMWFDFYPQDKTGESIDTILVLGSNYSIYSGTGGQNTYYEWKRNNLTIAEGEGLDTLFLENIGHADTGIYICYATNSLLPLLLLERRTVRITLDTIQNIIDKPGQNINIFPNPVSNIISIEFTNNHYPLHIKLFDLKGRYVNGLNITNTGGNKHLINLSGLEDGIYFLQIQTNTSTYTQKIIKAIRAAAY